MNHLPKLPEYPFPVPPLVFILIVFLASFLGGVLGGVFGGGMGSLLFYKPW